MTKGDGKPCKKCGTSKWRESSGQCIECQRRYDKQLRINNPGAYRDYSREWARENREKHNSWSQRWRDENPTKRREAVDNWRRDNPEKNAVDKHRRRARETGADGSHTASEWKALCKQYDYRCACCGEKAKLTADHVIPLVAGGSDDISNLQPLCKSCNSRKGTKKTDYRTKPGLIRWIQKRLFDN